MFLALCVFLASLVWSPLFDGDGPDDDEEAGDEPQTTLEVGGALRFNVVYRDWQAGSRARGGDFSFDTFRINADGSYGDLLLGAEYRFYSGYHMLKTGWVGYRFSEAWALKVGVHQVPFGITTYASHSWFFQIPYYLGLEDDHDTGLKVDYARGPWQVAAAFYKNAEGPFTGSSQASARYSYDVVPAAEGALDYGPAPVAGARFNQEVNQGNLKVTYVLDHGALGSTELGVSAQGGGLYHTDLDAMGHHAAGAVHLSGTYDRFMLKLELIRSTHDPAGPDDPFIVMGAYDAPYKVARDATIYVAGVAYTLPLSVGPFGSVRLYNDYSYLDKDPAAYIDTQQNITGALWAAGPLYVYTDVVVAKNHPFVVPGLEYASALAEGTDAWHVRLNMNIGYYY